VFKATRGTTIASSPQAVFDYVADAGLQHSWNALVRSMEPASEGPLGVGTRWRGDIARVGRVDVAPDQASTLGVGSPGAISCIAARRCRCSLVAG
jgi:hypothetical protein